MGMSVNGLKNMKKRYFRLSPAYLSYHKAEGLWWRQSCRKMHTYMCTHATHTNIHRHTQTYSTLTTHTKGSLLLPGPNKHSRMSHPLSLSTSLSLSRPLSLYLSLSRPLSLSLDLSLDLSSTPPVANVSLVARHRSSSLSWTEC